MATLTIADLDNGKRDLETVDAVANSSADTTTTRYGDSVLTLAGALRRLGYKAPIPYASGLNVDSPLFTVSYDGVVYAPDPEIVPFVTGAWDPAQWRVVQNDMNDHKLLIFKTLLEAQAAAAKLPDGQVVESPDADGRIARYEVQSGVLVFAGYVDQTRFDLADAVSPEKGASLVARAIARVDAITATSTAGLRDGDVIFAKGRTTDGDGGGGLFKYYANSTQTADGGLVFSPATGAGRFIRDGWTVFGFSGPVNPRWFGAKGDSVTDDTTAIRNATASGAGSVFFPDGVYVTTGPIYLDSGVSLYGGSKGKVKIKKTTAGVGSGGNVALDGTTDSYAQNAVVILRHPDNNYNYGASIRDITLESMFISEYGIYAPRASGLLLENVSIVGCRIGFQTHDAWMCQFTRVECDAVTRDGLDGDTYGWTTTSYGFVFSPKVANTPTGTSCTFNSCWAHDCHIGWNINFLEYSTLNSCGADNISSGSYLIESSGLTLNSCATENVQLNNNSAIAIIGGNVALNGFRTFRVRGSAAGTTAVLFADFGARVIMNTCRLDDFVSAGVSYNLVIQSGAKVIDNGSRLPTNGNGFVSYSGGAVRTTFGDSNPSVRTSDGIKFFTLAA